MNNLNGTIYYLHMLVFLLNWIRIPQTAPVVLIGQPLGIPEGGRIFSPHQDNVLNFNNCLYILQIPKVVTLKTDSVSCFESKVGTSSYMLS